MQLTRIYLALLFALLIQLSSAPMAEELNLPVIGVEGSTRMSETEERLLGEAFMRHLRQSLDIVEDPEIQSYISGLGFRLVSNSDFNRRHFKFFVVNDPNINAFAGPAGYIGVNAGLILTASSEAELAAVIAHEIAHVGQNHLERTFEATEKLSIPTAAALVAAIILGSTQPRLAEAALAATLAANMQTRLNFTRNHEVEADHIGMQILAQSNFSPHAMPRFFEKLQQADRLYDNNAPEFLRTHPVTTNRIAESRSRASQQKTPPGMADNMHFHLARAKLRVLSSNDPPRLLQELKVQLTQGSYLREVSQRYTYAMALLDAREYRKALRQLKRVTRLDSERLPYTLLEAKIELAAGQTNKGLKILRETYKLHPGDASAAWVLAEALLQNDQAGEALPILENQIKEDSEPGFYHMLAQSHGKLGHEVASHQALAEYYFLYGYTHVAIEQLRLAMEESDITDAEKHIVGRRLKEFKEIAILERQLL